MFHVVLQSQLQISDIFLRKNHPSVCCCRFQHFHIEFSWMCYPFHWHFVFTGFCHFQNELVTSLSPVYPLGRETKVNFAKSCTSNFDQWKWIDHLVSIINLDFEYYLFQLYPIRFSCGRQNIWGVFRISNLRIQKAKEKNQTNTEEKRDGSHNYNK